MSEALRARDEISGKEGKAYATIDGRRHLLFMAKKIEATVEKKKTARTSLGRRGEQHKTVGWTGKGSMTITYATDLFRDMILKYIRDGIDTYFDLQVINDDPQSELGQHETILKDCNIDSSLVALLDADSDTLEEDVDYTFEDIDIPRKFNKPSYVE